MQSIRHDVRGGGTACVPSYKLSSLLGGGVDGVCEGRFRRALCSCP